MNALKSKVICSVKSGCCLKSTIAGFQLVFHKFGNPDEVLQLEELMVPKDLKSNEVLVKMLAAAVHPADINTIQGTYGIKPTFPAIPGIEGVAEVLEVGSDVNNVKTHDRVIPLKRDFGTWRTHHVYKGEILEKVPPDVSVLSAVNIMGNPSTAYRMLSDFVSLRPGDTVIQNLANSAVGLAVVQIAQHLGLKTVNVIRNRPNVAELKRTISELGGNYVITDEELRTSSTQNIFQEIPLARLALNGTGGRCATDMFRYLAEKSTMVTYGGMSRQPVAVSATALIFNDISLRGFWFSRWVEQSDISEIREMMRFLFKLAQQGKLKPPPCSLVPLKNYQQALKLAMEPFIGQKQILKMDDTVN